jgi:S1-C subfamily serine protease
VDGQPATSLAILEKTTLTRQAGDAVNITYTRNGESTTVDVTLGDGP